MNGSAERDRFVWRGGGGGTRPKKDDMQTAEAAGSRVDSREARVARRPDENCGSSSSSAQRQQRRNATRLSCSLVWSCSCPIGRRGIGLAMIQLDRSPSSHPHLRQGHPHLRIPQLRVRRSNGMPSIEARLKCKCRYLGMHSTSQAYLSSLCLPRLHQLPMRTPTLHPAETIANPPTPSSSRLPASPRNSAASIPHRSHPTASMRSTCSLSISIRIRIRIRPASRLAKRAISAHRRSAKT